MNNVSEYCRFVFSACPLLSSCNLQSVYTLWRVPHCVSHLLCLCQRMVPNDTDYLLSLRFCMFPYAFLAHCACALGSSWCQNVPEGPKKTKLTKKRGTQGPTTTASSTNLLTVAYRLAEDKAKAKSRQRSKRRGGRKRRSEAKTRWEEEKGRHEGLCVSPTQG